MNNNTPCAKIEVTIFKDRQPNFKYEGDIQAIKSFLSDVHECTPFPVNYAAVITEEQFAAIKPASKEQQKKMHEAALRFTKICRDETKGSKMKNTQTIPFDEIDAAFKAPYYKKDFCTLIKAKRELFDESGWDTYTYKVNPPYEISEQGDDENRYDSKDIRYMFDLFDNNPVPGGRFDHFYINVDENAQTFRITHHYGYDC